MLKRVVTAFAVFVLAFNIFALKADAAYPSRFYNHVYSVAKLSASQTNPPASGSLFTLAPGQTGTGQCFYASAAKLTMYWYGSGSAKTAKAGAWNCPPYLGGGTYTIRIFN